VKCAFEKALYGTLRAALLFWQRLLSMLKNWGFIINPCDQCVGNKMIKGSQCTVLWYIDDLKISHVSADVVSSVIHMLEAEFGHEAPLRICRRWVHDYVGMALDFTMPGKVQFQMEDYVEELLKDIPSDMDGEASTPAANHLFMVNTGNQAVKLEANTAEFFHHVVATPAVPMQTRAS
jgi:hypothetical protein